eukprot:1868650-Pleurochrysis_carterae.AAC.1
MERTVILDDAYTVPDPTPDVASEVEFLHENNGANSKSKPAHELVVGGFSTAALQKKAAAFVAVVGNRLRVTGDGSCWLYALLAAC